MKSKVDLIENFELAELDFLVELGVMMGDVFYRTYRVNKTYGSVIEFIEIIEIIEGYMLFYSSKPPKVHHSHLLL